MDVRCLMEIVDKYIEKIGFVFHKRKPICISEVDMEKKGSVYYSTFHV